MLQIIQFLESIDPEIGRVIVMIIILLIIIVFGAAISSGNKLSGK